MLDYYNPAQHSANLPSPCKEPPTSDSEIHTKLYCYGLLALWIMLMFSAVIYQVRAILKIRDQLERGARGYGFIGLLLRALRSPFTTIRRLFGGGSGSSNVSETDEEAGDPRSPNPYT